MSTVREQAEFEDGSTQAVISGRVAETYTRRVFRRFRESIEPEGFTPNWADQPSRHKFYPQAPLIPLPAPFGGKLATLGESLRRLAGHSAPRDAVITVDDLSTLLAAYRINARRTRLTWGDDSAGRLRPSDAQWGRATASGGGMYPAETYLVVGQGSPVLPGIYHYNTAYHGLARLAVGDLTSRIRGAVKDEVLQSANVYVVAAARFWKSSFKYNTFTYHVVTQDVGALLGSWRILLSAAGVRCYASLWFDEQEVDAVLGLRTADESSFLVLGFNWDEQAGATLSGETVGSQVMGRRAYRVNRVIPLAWERSKSVRAFDEVQTVHHAALVGAAPRPPRDRVGEDLQVAVTGNPGVTASAADPRVTLPPAEALLRVETSACFRERRSSFGRFASPPPLRCEDLRDVLWASAMAARATTDVKTGIENRSWTRLWVLVNSVNGLNPGIYRYDSKRNELVTRAERDVASFLQQSYALSNYNLYQVAATMVITGFLAQALQAYGDRGYRMLNHEVGAVAQTAYLAAAAVGIGCGAVLGMDNVALDEALGIDGCGENSLLFVLLGNERPGPAGFVHELPARHAAQC